MRSTHDIAWLAGLLEGEGSFMHTNGTPNIALQTTDHDVLLRAAILMGVEEQASWRPGRKSHYKTVFACRAYGTRAISWMMTLYQFFGGRRQEKIREILGRWRASPRVPRAPRGQRFMAICHPDRVRSANMLCDTCYMREWRAARKLRRAALAAAAA